MSEQPDSPYKRTFAAGVLAGIEAENKRMENEIRDAVKGLTTNPLRISAFVSDLAKAIRKGRVPR